MEIATYALVSLEDVRSGAFLEDEQIKDDDELVRLINSHSAKVEKYCKRNFLAREYTEYHDGDGECRELFLDHFPILSVSGVWDDLNCDYTDDTLVEPDSYRIRSGEGIVFLTVAGAYFQSGMQNIKVVYSGGYAEVPEDIKEATVNWILLTYRRRKDKVAGQLSKSAPGGNVAFDLAPMSNEVKIVLDQYRKRII